MIGTNKTLPKTCFVSIDVEADFGKNITFEGAESLDKILDILKKNNIPATLFVSGDVLERYSEKFKEWSKSYEIASHSFTHRFWDALNNFERKEELEKFLNLYFQIFRQKPKGFRAPSHIIDEDGLKLLQDKGFLYDSSIVPHYPFFKKYRGYRGKFPTFPEQIDGLLEIPVSGLIFGIPLAGTWLSKLPFLLYRILFSISKPSFLTLNLHSWDSLNSKLLAKIEKVLILLKNKNYKFLTGEQIYELP